MTKKIGLVEDEEDLNQILSVYLGRNNYSYISCKSLKEANEYIDCNIDLWVIDIMLPDGSGIELLKSIKSKNRDIPVILISARGDSIDRLLGFEVGCDDYIPKPFLPEELIFRIQKLLDNNKEKFTTSKDILSIKNYKVNKVKRTIYDNDLPIDVTSREYDIILYFINNSSQAVTRDELLEKFWEKEYYGSDRVVDNYIKNIRKKLPRLTIETIYGYGYRCNI